MSYQSTGTVGASCDPVAEPLRLDRVQNSLEYSINSSQSALGRLARFADRLGGPVPEAVCKADPATPPPTSAVVLLERGTEALQRQFDLIFKQIERLEKF